MMMSYYSHWWCSAANPNPYPFVALRTQSLLLLNFRMAAASSSSSGGASYSEPPLLGVEKKKRSVAGIDQDDLVVDPSQLADPDSCFLDFKGVQIHHKIYETTNTNTNTKVVGFPFILLHGFGASLFSWHQAAKPLARATSSKVVSFDRPAFGLTSRSSAHKDNLNPYSMIFSVLATLTFIDSLAADKAILIGHSAGSFVAVNAYFEAPQRIAALILVAPAIFAPPASSTTTSKDMNNNNNNPFNTVGRVLLKLPIYILQLVSRMLKGMASMLSSVYKILLTKFLRSTVALMLLRIVIDKFGLLAVRNAWYDANKLTDHVLNGYIKPLKIKDWDRALLEYTLAMFTDSASGPPLSEKLSQISCPVLIVTGDGDRITPAWNAKRLARAIPGSSLEVIKNCGHLPHEEKMEEFVSIVQNFLQKVFKPPEERSLQSAYTRI